jgi:hypothetical protein
MGKPKTHLIVLAPVCAIQSTLRSASRGKWEESTTRIDVTETRRFKRRHA